VHRASILTYHKTSFIFKLESAVNTFLECLTDNASHLQIKALKNPNGDILPHNRESFSMIVKVGDAFAHLHVYAKNPSGSFMSFIKVTVSDGKQ
jgi:hypothetical protein